MAILILGKWADYTSTEQNQIKRMSKVTQFVYIQDIESLELFINIGIEPIPVKWINSHWYTDNGVAIPNNTITLCTKETYVKDKVPSDNVLMIDTYIESVYKEHRYKIEEIERKEIEDESDIYPDFSDESVLYGKLFQHFAKCDIKEHRTEHKQRDINRQRVIGNLL